MVRTATALGLVAGLFAAMVGPNCAAAEDPMLNFADDWTYRCIEDWESGEQVCTTEKLTIQNDRIFVIYFVNNSDGVAPLVITGEDQRFAEVGVKVDDEEAITSDLCDVGYCYFEADQSRRLLEQFKRGRRAHVWIKSDQSRHILDQTISLIGFINALSG